MSTDSIYFGTSGPIDAKIMAVAESWGKNEEEQRKPLVGQAGQEWDRMLAEAGISRSDILCTNVVSARPENNWMWAWFHPLHEKSAPFHKGCQPTPIVLEGISRLHALVEAVKPEIVLGLGAYASWALTDDAFNLGKVQKIPKGFPNRHVPTGIGSWRGSQCTLASNLPPAKFVPTIHPAAILRTWEWRARTLHDYRARVRPVLHGEDWYIPDYKFHINPSTETMKGIIYSLLQLSTPISIDIETHMGQIAYIGLGWSSTEAVCIPLLNKDGTSYFSLDDEHLIRTLLRKLFASDKQFILQNAIYDLTYLEAELLWPIGKMPYMDIMLAQHLCFPGTPKSLDYQSSMYCTYHKFWKEESQAWDPTANASLHQTYNCKDCVATWEIADFFDRKLLDHFGFREKFFGRFGRMHQFELAMRIAREGILIDRDERLRQQISVHDQIEEHASYLSHLMPDSCIELIRGPTAKSHWYNSPKQQSIFFYDLMQMKERYDRKSGSLTTNDAALAAFAEQEPILEPLCRALQAFRSLNVYYNNHLTAELEPGTDTLRCSVNVAGTKTFRWAMMENAFGRGTNLQNIPKGEQEEK